MHPPTESAAKTAASRPSTVALIGNPNTGKTTLFNALTGFSRRVANYPGVTVEIGTGPLRNARVAVEIVDLPGTYSLAALSPDERVVSDFAAGRIDGRAPPDAIVFIADASNLPRNLYLLSQAAELDLPVVVALNMIDVADGRGIAVDAGELSKRLGVPVVPVVATRRATLAPLVAAIESAARAPHAAPRCVRAVLPPALVEAAAALGHGLRVSETVQLVAERDGDAERGYAARGGDRSALAAVRQRLSDLGIDAAAAEVRARYSWVHALLDGVFVRPPRPIATWSDRLDRVLTHPVGGAAALLVVLTVVFQAIFSWAKPLMDFLSEGVFGRLSAWTATLLPEGALGSLLCDGLIGGVGGVVVFLPQILILFAVIAILEDCGYMARAAFMMDRVMRAAGLSGRSFIPLLSSFACAIPAIMGTRVIADRRDRFVTILIAPFMSCSARLPVYVLLIAAFVPDTSYAGGWLGLRGLVMLAMYAVGVLVAIPIAWLLKRTVLAGPTPGFLLEMPTYKLPRLRAIWQRMSMAGVDFLYRAGTIILLVNVVVWALGYFPRSDATAAAVQTRAAAERWGAERVESELAGAYLRDSYLGQMGRWIEPAVRPIGWDWRIGAAVVASFPAREVVVGTLGTIFNLADADADSSDLRGALQRATWPDGRPLFTLPVALSIMVFFALCAQCVSTLVIIGRETRSWVWPIASFAGMTLIAYAGALAVSAAARLAGA